MQESNKRRVDRAQFEMNAGAFNREHAVCVKLEENVFTNYINENRHFIVTSLLLGFLDPIEDFYH